MAKTDEDYDPFTADNFHLTPEERRRHNSQFDKLRPLLHQQAGRLSVDLMRIFMMTSEMPDSTLDKILELSDQDKDGFLDRYEFIVASQLTARAHDHGQHIPDQVFT